jgi:hypothetical protein
MRFWTVGEIYRRCSNGDLPANLEVTDQPVMDSPQFARARDGRVRPAHQTHVVRGTHPTRPNETSKSVIPAKAGIQNADEIIGLNLNFLDTCFRRCDEPFFNNLNSKQLECALCTG